MVERKRVEKRKHIRRASVILALCLAWSLIVPIGNWASAEGAGLANMWAVTALKEEPEGVFEATPKEEVIYGNLKHDGSLSKIYVVNILEGDAAESGKLLIDYGDYTRVKNLTSEAEIAIDGDLIQIETDEEILYYEGTLETAELPWRIEIRYFLDGTACTARELAGVSGEVRIALSIKENPKCSGSYFDDYALQASLSLDTNFCRNIRAEGATQANVGSQKQLTYTILPGREAEYAITTEASEFEMSQIAINGVKLAMDVELDESQLTEQVEQLVSGVSDLDEGAGTVKSGTASLSQATGRLLTGVESLRENVSASAYRTAAKGQGLDVGQLRSQNASAAGSLEQQISTLKAQIAQLEQAGAPKEQTEALRQQVATLEPLVELLGANNANIDGVDAYLDATNGSIGASQSGVRSLDQGIGEIDRGVGALKDGTTKMKDETSAAGDRIGAAIAETISRITGDDGQPESFVSSKNTEVRSLQFVLRTDAIESPEDEQ
ncbi:MAG: hypothetical protein Q4C25_07315 [Bacillota bacterium]|nr:hypothetical protein [Bacillota bacterium]